MPVELNKTFDEAVDSADGMTLGIDEVQRVYDEGRGREPVGARNGASPESVPSPPSAPPSAAISTSSSSSSSSSSVTSKLFEAYAAASGVAAAAASPLASAAGSIYAGLTSLPIPNPLLSSSGTSSSSGGLQSGGDPNSGTNTSKRVTAALGQAVVLSTRAASAVLAEGRLAAAGGSGRPSSEAVAHGDQTPTNSSLQPGPSASVSSVCPSEWFVCDDPVRSLRIFVIQGSDSLDHWKLNLTFDPVVFEDEALDVTVSDLQGYDLQGYLLHDLTLRALENNHNIHPSADPITGCVLYMQVHRGVYAAAQVLYDRFLPMVQEHLESSQFARVTFTVSPTSSYPSQNVQMSMPWI